MGRQTPAFTEGASISGGATIQSVHIQMREFVQSSTIRLGTFEQLEASQDGWRDPASVSIQIPSLGADR